MLNLRKDKIQKIRIYFQLLLLILTLISGYKLYCFYNHFVVDAPFEERPNIVDGFLPIGGLMSLRLLITSGSLHPIHPAATVILISALLTSLLFRKSFCGWLCPLGTFSDLVYSLGQKLFNRKFIIHRYADCFLRSIKYLFMSMVLYLTFFKLDTRYIELFLNTSYWKIADIRMLLLFLDIGKVTMIILLALITLSLLYKRFWCRYLCPYGALVGLIGSFSPVQVVRNEDNCIRCQKCIKKCPNLLKINTKAKISSLECNACLSCLSVCPSDKTLSVSFWGKMSVNPIVYFVAIYTLFFSIIAFAHFTGNWKSGVSYETYKEIVPVAGEMAHY